LLHDCNGERDAAECDQKDVGHVSKDGCWGLRGALLLAPNAGLRVAAK
jgi:hypothetical protein